MDEDDQVIEGFICPICMTDLKAPSQLTKHFEEVHNDDPEILKSLKDLFGKAKKKILKKDEINESLTEQNNVSIASNRKQYPEINWGPQEIGAIKSHTIYFREIRNTRLERYSAETNKLLIRLDKLLNNLPSDPIDRKVHEQTIVPWIDEKDVKLCPNCARSFHLARRKHHCRLCGAVMCHDCTMFLSILNARKMTNPMADDDTTISPTTTTDSKLTVSGEQHFRLCIHCMDLLEAREKLKTRQSTKPIVVKFYETMRTYMEEANKFLTMYMKMWESLSEGETTYDLRDAQILRVKIAKIGENVDNISKRILAIGTADIDNPPQGQVLRLHQMVRRSAEIFCKECISTTPSLPSEAEYIALQEKREKKIEERIAYERQLEIEEAIRERRRDQRLDSRNNSSTGQSSKTNEAIIEKSGGWGPSNAAAMVSTASMDPLIEQMSNLRSYIKQARSECKYDEVATLESNLKELQSAYFSITQSNND